MLALSAIRYSFLKLANISKYYTQISSFACKSYIHSSEMNKLTRLFNISVRYPQVLYPLKVEYLVNAKRSYSKKKKGQKKFVEEEEESDSEEDEDYESLEADEIGGNSNIVTKTVPSMRIDTVAKTAFGTTKKKIEKEFYASNLRINGEKVLKKAMLVAEGAEIDIVKSVSPDNEKFILVNRAIIKSIGKITGTGNYPLKIEVFKALTIENYPEPWKKSSSSELD